MSSTASRVESSTTVSSNSLTCFRAVLRNLIAESACFFASASLSARMAFFSARSLEMRAMFASRISAVPIRCLEYSVSMLVLTEPMLHRR